MEPVQYNTRYYEFIVLAVFQGSSEQLTREYNKGNYRLYATVTEHDAKDARTEAIKQVESSLA